MAMWAFFVKGKTLKDEITDKDFDWESMLNIRPLKEAMQRLGLSPSSTFSPFVDHETYDDFCKTLWNEEMIKLMSVPSYFVTGWFDDSIKGSLEHFPQMTQKHPDEQVRKSHKLSSDPGRIGFHLIPVSWGILIMGLSLWFPCKRRQRSGLITG